VIGERGGDACPPAERDVAMVFQTPALYPHLTVRENIAFPLELRGVADAQIARRVLEAAQRLGLDSVLDRLPAQLSEGQRQRAALGRAIVSQSQAFSSTNRCPGWTRRSASSCGASCWRCTGPSVRR